MPSRLRHLSFIVAVGIQAVLLAMLPSSAYKVREVGVTVFLKVGPMDPYDVLSGYYVILDYEIARPAALAITPDLVQGQQVFVMIRDRPDGSWHATRVLTEKPELAATGELALRADYMAERFQFGIESYFIPEEVRDEVEADLRAHPDDARAEVRVDPASGKAAIVGLHIAGRSY